MSRREPERSRASAFAEVVPAARVAVPWVAWVAVFGVALVARLAFVAVMPPEIPWPDGREYDAVARSLVSGHGYGLQTLRPPGYPTFIAGVHALSDGRLDVLRATEAVVGAVGVVLLGIVGARAFFPLAGLLAALLAAIHPVLSFMPATQYSENLMVFVLVLAFGALLAAARARTFVRWALAGVLFGIAALTRPNVVLLLPGAAVGLLAWRIRERRAWWPGAAVFTIALALTVAPWIVRNHAVHDHWYFIATGGGRQFWIGNNPDATGATTVSVWPDSGMLARMAAMPDDMAREKYLYGEAQSWVRAHPAQAARLWLVKLGNLFALWPETFSRTRWMTEASRWAQGLASLLIFAGALLSLREARRFPALWPLLGAIVSFALVNALFFSVMRYRLAFEPCLLWMAGLGWATTLTAFRARTSAA